MANRHYSNKKISALNYAFSYIPVLIISLFGGIVVDKFFFLVFIGIIIYGILDYVVFDAFLDRLSWNLFWSRFYEPNEANTPPDYDTIKKFDKKPTPDNYAELEKDLTKK